jgi:hypothetical protein
VVGSAAGGAAVREVVARDHATGGPAPRGAPRGEDRDGASDRAGVHLAAGRRAATPSAISTCCNPRGSPRASAAIAPRSRRPPTCS